MLLIWNLSLSSPKWTVYIFIQWFGRLQVSFERELLRYALFDKVHTKRFRWVTIMKISRWRNMPPFWDLIDSNTLPLVWPQVGALWITTRRCLSYIQYQDDYDSAVKRFWVRFKRSGFWNKQKSRISSVTSTICMMEDSRNLCMWQVFKSGRLVIEDRQNWQQREQSIISEDTYWSGKAHYQFLDSTILITAANYV